MRKMEPSRATYEHESQRQTFGKGAKLGPIGQQTMSLNPSRQECRQGGDVSNQKYAGQ